MSTWWDRLKNPKCDLCPLHKEANRVCSVTGRGWVHSRVMFVGEAPGETEEKRGLPFMGRAGQMLLELLQSSEWDAGYTVTNAVCCRPPNNRPPRTSEWRTCSQHYLRRSILKQRPVLIVCLGLTALKSVLNDSSIKLKDSRRRVFHIEAQIRGKGRGSDTTPRTRKIPVVCTYHPAAVLRDPTKRSIVENDLRDFMRLLAGDKLQEDPSDKVYKWQSDDEDLPWNFSAGHALSFDLETTGFNPFKPGARILAAGVSQAPLHAHAFFVGDNMATRRFQKTLLSKSLKVGHNIKFDLLWLKKNGFRTRGPFFDTMVAFHLLDENYPDKRLEHLAAVFTPMGHYSGGVKEDRDKPGFMEELFTKTPERGFEYVCGDADATYRLHLLFERRLKTEGLVPAFKLLMRTMQTLVDVEHAGAMVDQDELDIQARKTEKHVKSVLGWLERNWPGVNFNSPKQVSKLVHDKFKLKPVKFTEKMFPSTDDEALTKLHDKAREPHQQKTIRGVLELRKWSKILSTYIRPLRDEHTMPDGFVHPRYNVVGAVSRISCQEPNFQNIPPQFRRVFVSRWGDDGAIVQADGSQMELRVLAHYCKEPRLLDAFAHDRDVHLETASGVFNKPANEITKEERYLAKTVNFLIIYGGGPKRLAAEAKISLPEAASFIDEYNARMPKIKAWIHKIRRECLLRGQVRSLFGRIRRLPIDDPESPAGQRALRQAVNFPIQDTAALLTLLCMNDIHAILRRGMRSKIIGTVHDSIIFDCPKDELETVMMITEEVWDRPNTQQYGFELEVPLKVDISYGPNWLDQTRLPDGKAA